MTNHLEAELKNHWYTIEEQTVISLEYIRRDRLRKGLPFDEKFKEDFLHAANTMYLSIDYMLIFKDKPNSSQFSFQLTINLYFSHSCTESRLCDTLDQFMMARSFNSTGSVNINDSPVPANGQTNQAMTSSCDNPGGGTKDTFACEQNHTEIINLISDDEFEEKPNISDLE